MSTDRLEFKAEKLVLMTKTEKIPKWESLGKMFQRQTHRIFGGCCGLEHFP